MGSDQDAERRKAQVSAEFKSLELLYDYTKFHIGLYLTLTASYVTVATIKVAEASGGKATQFLETNRPLMVLAVLCFLVAGLAAGVIASSITQHLGGSSNDFLERELGPWHLKWGKGLYWTWWEHTAFWLGILAATLSIMLPLKPSASRPHDRPTLRQS